MNLRTNPLVRVGAAMLLVVSSACAQADSDAAEGMATSQPFAALMTDHHSVYIDRPAGEVWAEIRRLYADGGRYAGYGNQIVAIGDDPTAYRGGYLAIETTEDGGRLERGVFRFSDIDDEKRFLAMSIETPDPTVANLVVTHQVTPAGSGSSYSVVIHGDLLLGDGTGARMTQSEVAAEMEQRITAHNEGLKRVMEAVKAELEGGA